MAPPTDRSLLAELRAPQPDAALAALMERHGAMVLATCERVAGDRHDAEEAAQVVFLILVRKAARLGDVACLAAWLHRTARFVALRVRTGRLRRSRREAPLGAVAEPASAVTGSDELRERLDAALDRLPAIYREALLLHYVEGRSCEEIAAAVGASTETIAMRLSRGRERLRRRLRQPPADAFTRTLGGIAAMPTAKLAPATVLAPTTAAQALLGQCVVAAKTAVVATATAGLTAAAALVLGAVVLTQRLTAAEPHGDPPRPPVVVAAQAVGMPLCEPWEARLQAALQRPVTIHAGGADALASLRRIGERCELPMVVDLAPDHASLPRITVDVDGAPLGEVVEAIAHQAALRAGFRAGTLWWEDRGPQLNGGPTALWVYPLDPARLPAGGDPAVLVDQLRKTIAPSSWDGEGVGIELRTGMELFISQTAAMQLRIERFLRDRLRSPPRADDPAMQAAAKLLPPAFSDMPAGERRLRATLTAPVTIGDGATSLAQVVDAVAKATGLRIAVADGVSLDRPPARHTAEIHLQAIEARHALELALQGSGLHVEFRASPTEADASVVIASGKAPMVKRRYDLTPLTRARKDAAGHEVETPDTQEFIDIMQQVVMPSSWAAEGVSIQDEDGAAIVVQTVEAQDAIEELVTRLGRMEVIGDASNRLPVPPALTIELPTSREF